MMEKNGNTFVPGETVVLARGDRRAKYAAYRIKGVVMPEVSEDKVKVAWSDGSLSWESPEDLDRA